MVEDTTDFLQMLIEGSNNVILVGDFNCKEIHWQDWMEYRRRRGDMGKQTVG